MLFRTTLAFDYQVRRRSNHVQVKFLQRPKEFLERGWDFIKQNLIFDEMRLFKMAGLKYS